MKTFFFSVKVTYKVSNRPETSVRVFLQKTHEQRADGLWLSRRQKQRLVEDPVIHLTHVTAVEGRLKSPSIEGEHCWVFYTYENVAKPSLSAYKYLDLLRETSQMQTIVSIKRMCPKESERKNAELHCGNKTISIYRVWF